MLKVSLLILFFTISQFGFCQEALNVFDVARKGTVEQAKVLLQQDPQIFNTENNEGYSPLMLACYRGNNEVAGFLIENGSNVNASSPMGTPLMAAVVKGNIEVAKLLMDKKADVNLTDAKGVTPLMYAVQFKNKELVTLLLSHKADRLKKDALGKTAFEYAVFAGDETIINLLK